jgi:hypothetical protein
MTPPVTIDTEVEKLRANPKRVVAVATSSLSTRDCKAISGSWNTSPTPMPETIYIVTISAREEWTPSLMRRLKPNVVIVIPIQMSSRYRPVR